MRGPLPTLLCVAVLFLAGWHLAAAAAEQLVFADSFEAEETGWRGSGEFRPSDEHAAPGKGKRSLLILRGSCETAPIPVEPESRYLVRLNSFSEHPGSFTLQAIELDRDGKALTPDFANRTSEILWGRSTGKERERKFWLPVALYFDTGKEAATVRLLIRKSGGPERRLWIDDVRIEKVTSDRPCPVPDPEVPGELSRDALMVPGPDGYLYPNFSRAGLAEPWKPAERIFRVEAFGAVANDGGDDSDAIAAAIDAAARAGGGEVRFGAGSYRLTRKISVRSDNVVLRGSGSETTRLEFGLPDNGVGLYTTGSGDLLSPRATIRCYFPEAGAKEVRIRIGKRAPSIYRPEEFESLPDAPLFSMVIFRVSPHFEALGGTGRQTVTAEVEYEGGRIVTTSTPFLLDRDEHPNTYASSVITFAGKNPPEEKKRMLTASAGRGDRILKLDDTEGIAPGDILFLFRPITAEWELIPGAKCPWWRSLCTGVRVAAVEGKDVKLEQPLRESHPLAAAPYVTSPPMLRNSGIEGLTLAQVGEIQIELKMRGVTFTRAFNCRAADLRIDRPGTAGVYGDRVKNCEFVNCRFTAPWRTKTGGLAYVGWDRAWDCLIDRVQSDRMRHAPLFNWDCSGNVVTGSDFNESDAQFHCGWAHENLIDNCRITTTSGKYNSYGWAVYSVPADDTMHGYIGPRNVLYNCRTSSFRGGIYMGGPNQNWMLMYNSFQTDAGPGVYTRFGVRNTRIVGNVFRLGDPRMPMVYFESLDAAGDHLVSNRLYGGNGRFTGGPGAAAATLENNRAFPLSEEAAEPAPPVPSLYLWQRQHCK